MADEETKKYLHDDGKGYDSPEVISIANGVTIEKGFPNRSLITKEEAEKIIKTPEFQNCFTFFEAKWLGICDRMETHKLQDEDLSVIENDYKLIFFALLTIEAQGEGRYVIVGKDKRPYVPVNSVNPYNMDNKAFVYTRGAEGERGSLVTTQLSNLDRTEIKGMFNEMMQLSTDEYEDKEERAELGRNLRKVYKVLGLNQTQATKLTPIEEEGHFVFKGKNKVGGFDSPAGREAFTKSAFDEVKNLISAKKAYTIYSMNEDEYDAIHRKFNATCEKYLAQIDAEQSVLSFAELDKLQDKAATCANISDFMTILINHAYNGCGVIKKDITMDELRDGHQVDFEKPYNGDIGCVGMDRLLGFRNFDNTYCVYKSKEYNLKHLNSQLETARELMPELAEQVDAMQKIIGMKEKGRGK